MGKGDKAMDVKQGGGRMAVVGGAAALMAAPLPLAVPLSELTSDPGPTVFLLLLLGGVALAWELGLRARGRADYAAGAAIAVAAGLLGLWINLAVGIIGSEDNPANLIYAGVLAVAVGGALLARFRPAGMAAAMGAAAAAQLLAFAVALIGGLGFTGPITVFFCALWLISAASFRRAARGRLHVPSPEGIGGG